MHLFQRGLSGLPSWRLGAKFTSAASRFCQSPQRSIISGASVVAADYPCYN